MSALQLSFLMLEPTAIDINGVDGGMVSAIPTSPFTQLAVQALALKAVDDWVFGLGFTNWKAVIDHALNTGHYELFDSEDGLLGLRKHGYRYAPIPRLPAQAASYIRQRLLKIGADKGLFSARTERMIQANTEVSHKFEINGDCLDLTVKQGDKILRASLAIESVVFSDTKLDCTYDLSNQLRTALISAGAWDTDELHAGCKSLARALNKASQAVKP